MTAKEMFKKEGWEGFVSDDGRFLRYEKSTNDDDDYMRESIAIDLFEKDIQFCEYIDEPSSLVLNKNEVDAFLELIKELKEAGKWNLNTIY